MRPPPTRSSSTTRRPKRSISRAGGFPTRRATISNTRFHQAARWQVASTWCSTNRTSIRAEEATRPISRLSAGGDEVWLLEPDTTGKPLRFADTVSFDATLAGISVGRVPNGDPRYELFPLTGPTLGGPNEPHAPGDVILSEIHYHPAAPPPGSTITELQLEFVELYNRSGAALDLSGWQIQGAVELELPSGTSLAAGEVLVLVPFDPQDSVLASEFRTIHQMSDTVRLIGPYLGLLKNGGESVRLQAPTAPPVGEPGPVYYLVDQ